MYIKSIVLDGFKSYGTRTEIVGFDQLFNAITGLNGSGKSNILDAICFVLGLSNMSLARCTTLRELIYKNGQAGVHKAIVTITFDNSNQDNSPVGYEHHKEIVIRREVHLNSRTKYYVCGQSASNSQVSDLFHSVHLNISNPHFLIMQGRITKVLNMKPPEILSMVEEATGVSMYESKKKSTQSMIEKKDQAIRFIDSLINETILPKLEQLRKEHANLIDYQNLLGELEILSKHLIGWQFLQNQKKADKALDKTAKCKDVIENFESTIKELENKRSDITSQINKLEQKSDEMSGGRIAELENDLKLEEKVDIKETGNLDRLNDNLEEIKKKKNDVEKQLKKDEQLKNKKNNEYENLKHDFDKIEEEYTDAQSEYEKAQRNYDAIAAGKALNEDGEASESLADQLIKAEEDYNRSNTEIKITKTKLSHNETQLKEKKAEANKYKTEYEKDNKHIAEIECTVIDMKKKLDVIGYNDLQYNKLMEERQLLLENLNKAKNIIKTEEANYYSQLNFEFTNPTPNFNRNTVKGLVCKLFTIKDSKYARAIESAAGGRLYHVITDNQHTCQQILDRGNLRRRHNFIALNKIQGKSIDKKSIEYARKLAEDSDIHAAHDMVEYEQFLRPAMEYVFGDTIIAPNVGKAMKITYSQLKKRAVTFDGDNIMPGGDMTGGAAPKYESFLVKLVSLKEKYDLVQQMEFRLSEVQVELSSLESLRKQYLSLNAEYQHHNSKLEVVKNRLKQTSSHHQLFEQVAVLEQEIVSLKESLISLEELSKTSCIRRTTLKQKLGNKEQSHKKELDNAEKSLAKTKNEVDSKKKQIALRKGKVESLRLEIEDLNKSCQQYISSIESMNGVLDLKSKDVDKQKGVVDDVRGKVQELTNLLKKEKAKLRQQNDEMNMLSRKRDKIVAEIDEKRLEIKKIEHEIDQIDSEAKDAADAVKSMIHKYDWISNEKHLFEKNPTNYPFCRKGFDIKELNAKVQKLQASKVSLSKTVNQRANVLLTDKEKESEELRRKRAIIEEDRDKLIKYMDEVDMKKKDALHKAWIKINIDFDSIFSTFLPNTHAKLDLVPGKDLLYGLEVRVAFGDVWKESLTELSGGQRSLVALSLILALLKYNPAPLYILDEVDAALDQNHTQNTGTMIKKHFNKSQFVIVSLKDDMFRNANVLFKTKFVNGKSTVTRYTHGNVK